MRLGEMQTLEIVKKVDFGVYLAEGGEPQERVLLPAKQVPEGARPGDKLEVLSYTGGRLLIRGDIKRVEFDG